MKSKNESKRSIFPEDLSNLGQIPEDYKDNSVFDRIEILSSEILNNPDVRRRYALLRDSGLEEKDLTKSDMISLIKSGYRLPEAKSPEKMLLSSSRADEAEGNEENKGHERAPYRMVNLISSSFRLPDIDEDNFLK